MKVTTGIALGFLTVCLGIAALYFLNQQPRPTVKITVDRESCAFLKSQAASPIIANECVFNATRRGESFRVADITVPAGRVLGWRDE